MNVVLGSMFRDAASYLSRYIAQTESLRALLESRGDTLRVVAVENDSTDGTFLMLDNWGANHFADVTLLHVHDDCPYYDSVDYQPRWQHHAWVANHVLAEVDDRDDILAYVESDLLWTSDALLHLIDSAAGLGAVSCPVWYRTPGERYYDTWGSRKDGEKFRPWEPYHVGWTGGVIEMDSVASVLAVKADIARKTRYQPEDSFVGWCRDIRGQGHQIWLDPSVWVVHP